jgi:hypothetical protein
VSKWGASSACLPQLVRLARWHVRCDHRFDVKITIEDIDLRALLEYLAGVFSGAPPEGAIAGRTAFRDALVAKLACSQLEAEELVDSLVLRGFLRLTSSPEAGEFWTIAGPSRGPRPD